MPAGKASTSRIELLQGTLDLLVLQTLLWGPEHGYGITQRLRTASGDALKIETGSLYPALHRLARRGAISAEWRTSENRQRVRIYRLTAAGRKQLQSEVETWDRLSSAVSLILGRTAEASR